MKVEAQGITGKSASCVFRRRPNTVAALLQKRGLNAQISSGPTVSMLRV